MKIAPRSRWCDAQLPGSAEEPCRATWAAQAGSRPDEELYTGVTRRGSDRELCLSNVMRSSESNDRV